MDDRAHRIGLNEVMFRSVNEQIEGLNRKLGDVSDNSMHIVCECGDASCMDRLVVPVGDYERVRSDSTFFLVLPGHEKPDVEVVVEERDGWLVVRKKEPEPAELAREADPRS